MSKVRRFRRKADTVEAVQWRPGVQHPAVRQITVQVPVFDEFDSPWQFCWVVRVHDSDVQIFPGDWITSSPEGFGVCRDDYFRRIYKPVED